MSNKSAFRDGFRDGIPIALGYFSVSFSLGVAARNAGLNAFQGALASLLNNASAGEYAGFTVIAANATYFEMVVMIFIANARYLLMSCALSQRFSPDSKLIHRFLVGYAVTDEIFGITIARPGFINPYYSYGAISIAIPAWSVGTALGVFAGNILPGRVVSALSVALFGMFLAIIIPPSKKDKIVGLFVLLGFFFSFLFSKLPVVSGLTAGTRTIILTVVLSAAAAFFFPIRDEAGKEEA